MFSDGMEDIDFDAVRSTSGSLSNEAAKHRIAIKPKSRRLSSKVSMRRREVSIHRYSGKVTQNAYH